MKISLAQLNLTIGDFENNFNKIKQFVDKALKTNSEIVAFPEMAVSSYPANDLLLKEGFLKENEKYTQKIVELTKNSHLTILLGTIHRQDGEMFNAAYLINKGKVQNIITKSNLPNHSVFKESRYFTPKKCNNIVTLHGKKIAIFICRDIWGSDAREDKFPNHIIKNEIDAIITINASPFEKNKFNKRLKLVKSITTTHKCSLFYVNSIGGQDNIIFDGGSFAINESGDLLNKPKFFKESLETFELNKPKIFNMPIIDNQKMIYEALVTSLRDYTKRNGFKSVLIGLSGGIDSALTCAIAIDAMGKDNVHAIALPSKYTSKESFLDASQCQKLMDIFRIDEINIQNLINIAEETLAPFFIGTTNDVTEENLQSRMRGIILMAISNKFGSMLLTTGNKSEIATGYSTLYGDMCGSYNLLKDLYKTEVFSLAKWRNSNHSNFFYGNVGKVIPDNIITKEPTAELKENQKDSDHLPNYEILDEILYELIENDKSTEEIHHALGHSKELIKQISQMLKSSEFKRYQSSPGTRLSCKSFGSDRDVPISHKFSF